MGVLEFSLDTAAYQRLAVRPCRNVTYDHIRLVDEHKIPCVYLAVDIPLDLQDFLQIEPHLLPSEVSSTIFKPACRGLVGIIRQIRLFKIAGVKTDKMLFHLIAKFKNSAPAPAAYRPRASSENSGMPFFDAARTSVGKTSQPSRHPARVQRSKTASGH